MKIIMWLNEPKNMAKKKKVWLNELHLISFLSLPSKLDHHHFATPGTISCSIRHTLFLLIDSITTIDGTSLHVVGDLELELSLLLDHYHFAMPGND